MLVLKSSFVIIRIQSDYILIVFAQDFRKGMNVYLKRHQYGNTFTEDLWVALQEASGKPIKAVMSSWTKQVGFPVVTVESSVHENNSRVLVLSQSKCCAENAKKGLYTFFLRRASTVNSFITREYCDSPL